MPPKGKQNNKNKKKAAPKRLNVPKVDWESQNPTQRAETLREIKTKFGALGLKNVEIVESIETQQPSGLSVQQLTAVGACTEAQSKELGKFENLGEVFDKFEVTVANVVVGSKMPFLVSAFDLEEKDHPILEDRRGKYVFIQFWAPWNERCQKAAAKLMAVVQKRGAEWAGKVCFLTVACDTTLDKLKAALTSRAWTDAPNVTHLWSGPSSPSHSEDVEDIITKYELEDLPECMIIDGEGKLLKRGDIEDFDPEAHLEKLLGGAKDYEGELKAHEPGTWQSLGPERRAELVTQVSTELKSDPRYSNLVLVLTEAKIHPVLGTLIQEESCVTLMGKVDVSVESKVPLISKIIRDAPVSDLEQVVMVACAPAAVDPAPACFICKKAFTKEDVRWHCAMCASGVTMCTACINKDSKAPRGERSTHPQYHPWFRIGPATTVDDLKNLEHPIGAFAVAMIDEAEEEKKAQHSPQEADKGTRVVHEDVYCNGCKTGPISDMPRWKCCSCADFDFCDDCFTKHIQNTPAKKAPKPKKGKAAKTKEPAGHDQRHVFLRIDDSELVRLAAEDDEGDMGFDEGDMDLLDGEDIEGFNGTEAIVQKIRELSAGGGLDDEDEDDEQTTSKGKPKIREVANSEEESPEEGEKAGSEEDSEAEDGGKPKPKPKSKAKKTEVLEGSDDDSEAEDVQLNKLAEEAAAIPLPDDDEEP